MKSYSSGSGSMIEDSLYTVGSAHYDEDSSSELLESSSNASNLASSGMLS